MDPVERRSGGDLVSNTFLNRIRDTKATDDLERELASIERSIRALLIMIADDSDRPINSHTDQKRSLEEMNKKRDIISAQLRQVLTKKGHSIYTH